MVAFAFIAVAVSVLLGDAAVRGSWSGAARGAGPAALVVWAGWMLLVRPSIRVLPDRAIVINVGRITEVPWERVVDIRRRLQLIFDLDSGRSLEAWGSPFLSKRSTARTPAVADPALDVVRGAWMSRHEGEDAPVVRRPDTVALVLGGAAVVAALLSITLGTAR